MAVNERGIAAEREVDGRVGEILHRLGDDVKTIARDEIELARLELERSARVAAAGVVVVLLGGTVALIGLGLLAVSAVDALEPLIAPLWLRLILMAGVYLAIGAAVVAAFGRRLRREAPPDMEPVADEAKRTVRAVRRALGTDRPALPE
jgi:hypothetical protein